MLFSGEMLSLSGRNALFSGENALFMGESALFSGETFSLAEKRSLRTKMHSLNEKLCNSCCSSHSVSNQLLSLLDSRVSALLADEAKPDRYVLENPGCNI